MRGLVLLLFGLAGCVHVLPAPDVEHPLGTTTDVPVGVVTGHSSSFEILKLKRWGDDSLEAALADARRKGGPDADGIAAASAERKLICFPLCWFPLVRSVQTTATATLLRLGRDRTTAPARDHEQKLEVGERPTASALLTRLEHLYAESPTAARAFYDSLSGPQRDDLRDEVLGSRGVASAYGTTFRPAKGSPPEERKFLEWFVGGFTTYTLVDE